MELLIIDNLFSIHCHPANPLSPILTNCWIGPVLSIFYRIFCMGRPISGATKLTATKLTVSEAVKNVGGASAAPPSSTSSTLSALQSASQEIEKETKVSGVKFDGETMKEIDSAANVLAGKSTASPKKLTFEDAEPPVRAAPPKKARQPTGYPSRKTAEDSRGLNKTSERTPEGVKSKRDKNKDKERRRKEVRK